MFRHTLLLAYRSFLRFKSTFFINLVGLSTGLAGALLIYLWVNDEWSTDKFHAKGDQLFQVMQNVQSGENILTLDSTPAPLAKALADEMPEVEEVAVVTSPMKGQGAKGIISVGDTQLKARGMYVSQNFFNVFSYNLIRGNKDQVLSDRYAVLLSEELALKLFSTTDNIVGKTVAFARGNLSGQYTVAGVLKKPIEYAATTFDLVFTFDLFYERNLANLNLQDWGNSNPSTYLVLKAGANVDQINNKIKNFLQSKNKHSTATLFLQRYSDKYLYNQYENGAPVGGRIKYVKLFSIIALFILVIACINFMNLSTAKASRRLKEIGVKKVFGASRRILMLQYLGESLLLTVLALVVALVLVVLLLPQFNQITGKPLSLHFNTTLILALVSITIITGLFAGSYPAFHLTNFSPVTVLKARFTSAGGTWIRQGLVVFQFTISIILIVAVVVVYGQIQLIQTKNLGYNKDNIIYFAKEGKLTEGLQTFLTEIKNIPGVKNAASFGSDLLGNHGGTSGVEWEGKNPAVEMEFSNLEVDYNLMELLDLKMKEGRTFSKEYGSDSSKIIFNQAAIAAMGLQDPVGKTIKLWGEDRQIIGVVQDFHFESLHEKIKPCFLLLRPNGNNILIKMVAGTERTTLEQISKFYNEFNGGLPFDYKFLDEEYQVLYAAEQRVAVLARYFAGVAILISCLGLFGLAAFTAERRQKEIGVRKVLGASRANIVYLLSSDFTKLVVVAISIALPLSYLVVKQWLNNFEYRIDLEWWYFVGAGLAALVIAWLTVSTQAVKAASVNPVHSLKDE